MTVIRILVSLLLTSALAASGCVRRAADEVVVYTALDQEFSQPIFSDFEQATGATVLTKFDTESTKTVGLVEALIAEQARPRCDVFWNNEILHTIRLAKLGLLEPYATSAAKDYPAMYQAPDHSWHGFAARARVLVVNTNLLSEDQRPQSIEDLIDPKWRGKVGLAKPLHGTTATHAACLFAVWGEERARQFFSGLKENAKIMAGNKQVALAVGAGQLAFGLTDTDDAIVELEKGMPVAIVYPDQGKDQLGTLFIPNTLALVKGSPNPDQAKRLIDYLLSPDVEAKLVEGLGAQIPLNRKTQARCRVETPRTRKAMQVDFAKAADGWEKTSEFLRDTFAGG